MVGKQRARSAEAKRLRRESIVDAAIRLLDRVGHDRVRMDDLAAEAGLAKGTLYLYFKQRSDVFLAVADRSLHEWLASVDAHVRPDLRRRGGYALADAFVAPLRGNPEIINRVSLHTGAYAASTAELRAESRAAFVLVARRLGDLVESRLTEAEPASGLRIVLLAQALLVGLSHVASLSADSAELDPTAELTAIDVATELRRLLPAVMKGAVTDA